MGTKEDGWDEAREVLAEQRAEDPRYNDEVDDPLEDELEQEACAEYEDQQSALAEAESKATEEAVKADWTDSLESAADFLHENGYVVIEEERMQLIAQMLVSFRSSMEVLTKALETAFGEGLHSPEALKVLTELHAGATKTQDMMPGAFQAVGIVDVPPEGDLARSLVKDITPPEYEPDAQDYSSEADYDKALDEWDARHPSAPAPALEGDEAPNVSELTAPLSEEAAETIKKEGNGELGVVRLTGKDDGKRH